MPETTTIPRISGPAELTGSVPHLLGFHPEDSIVVVGLNDTMLVATGRVDLDELGALSQLFEALARGGANRAVVLVYSADTDANGIYVDRVAPAADLAASANGLDLIDLLRVHDGRYWGLRCADQTCCPPEGRIVDELSAAATALAVDTGSAPLSSRDELEKLFTPLEANDPHAVWSDQLEYLLLRTSHDQQDPRFNAYKRRVFAAARVEGRPGPISGAQASELGAALQDIAVRDALWYAIDEGKLDGRELWRTLARQLPGRYAVPALFLYAWASWRLGNGAEANVAIGRVLQLEPGYSAAVMLEGAMKLGVDPRKMPKLRRGA